VIIVIKLKIHNMKGKLFKDKDKVWSVFYIKEYPSGNLTKTLPLYIGDFDKKKSKEPTMVLEEGKEINFEIVTEFTHPHLYENVGWGDGIDYAKII